MQARFDNLDQVIEHLKSIGSAGSNIDRFERLRGLVNSNKPLSAFADCLDYVSDIDFVQQVIAVAGSIKARHDEGNLYREVVKSFHVTHSDAGFEVNCSDYSCRTFKTLAEVLDWMNLVLTSEL